MAKGVEGRLNVILIGLGSNRSGAWGSPRRTLMRAVRELAGLGLRLRAVSGFYETEAMGPGHQSPYVNAVVAVDGAAPPGTLLRRLKRLERAAGRRSATRWGPRALDLDILDYKGQIRAWPPGTAGRRSHGHLVLPHSRLHERPFVLRPLLDVAPRWRHPVTGRSARALWRRAERAKGGRILRKLS